MRQQVTLVHCDVCGKETQEARDPLKWSWDGQPMEIDLCEKDHVKASLADLLEKSRKVGKRGRKPGSQKVSAPSTPETEKYAPFFDGKKYLCPAEGCEKGLSSPNGLAVHHSRAHGAPLFSEAS